MLIVLLILWGSAFVGYLLRRWPQPWVGGLLTVSIWLMLFAIGIEVGSNEVLTRSLGRLGAEALPGFYLESLPQMQTLCELARDIAQGAAAYGAFDTDWDQKYNQGQPVNTD